MISRIEDWSDGWASSIVILHGIHVGWVGTDSDPSSLVSVPVGEVVERARAESIRDYRAHTDFRPFSGLIKADPRKGSCSPFARIAKWRLPWRSLEIDDSGVAC